MWSSHLSCHLLNRRRFTTNYRKKSVKKTKINLEAKVNADTTEANKEITELVNKVEGLEAEIPLSIAADGAVRTIDGVEVSLDKLQQSALTTAQSMSSIGRSAGLIGDVSGQIEQMGKKATFSTNQLRPLTAHVHTLAGTKLHGLNSQFNQFTGLIKTSGQAMTTFSKEFKASMSGANTAGFVNSIKQIPTALISVKLY